MQIVETVFMENAKLVNGEIADVVVCGQTSRNKRRYNAAALQKALHFYEGKEVYVNHDPKATLRNANDRIGTLKDVYWDGERIRAKRLVILESHAMTPKVQEDLTRNLGFFGLSHVIDGQYTVDKDGVQVVEQIDRVTSVDLVSNAATCRSLMEQQDAEAPSADDAIDQAFSQAVMAVCQDKALDKAGKMKKIKDILTAQEKLTAKADAAAPADAPSPADAPPATEQTLQTLATQVEQLRTELATLKPKKYLLAPTSAPRLVPAGVASNLQEQAGEIPTDPVILRRWLRK